MACRETAAAPPRLRRAGGTCREGQTKNQGRKRRHEMGKKKLQFADRHGPWREAWRRATTTPPQTRKPGRARPQTANKLCYVRPKRPSKPRPQTQIVFLPPDPVWAGRALTQAKPGPPSCVVSDSLVDNRGCLTDRTEGQTFPGNVNLKRRRSLYSTLDERLGERVFHVLL